MSLAWEKHSADKPEGLLSTVSGWLTIAIVTGWWGFTAIRFAVLEYRRHLAVRLIFAAILVAIVAIALKSATGSGKGCK